MTEQPWEEVTYLGRTIKVETCAEIIAKKMHFRGASAKARDLFDLCAVAEMEPGAIPVVMPYMQPTSAAFLKRLTDYRELAKDEFSKIDRLQYDRSFDDCLQLAFDLLRPAAAGRL